MKRKATLIAILLLLAWIGSKVTSPTSSPSQSVVDATNLQNSSKVPLSIEEKKAQQENWFGAETIVSAQKAVRRMMKDPDAVQFKDVYANYTEQYGVAACGLVNSKNSYGAYTGFKRFVSSGKSVILEGRDNIKSAWENACLR